MKELIVLSVGPPGEQERNLVELAGWMGAPARVVAVEGNGEIADRLGRPGTGREVCLAMNGDTLAALGRSGFLEGFTSFLREFCDALLVFGVAHPSHHEAVHRLTQGAVSVRPMPESSDEPSFSFPEGARLLSCQLTGVAFTAGPRPGRTALQIASPGIAEAIMVQGQAPVFAHTRLAACSLFLLTDAPIPAVHEEIASANTRGGVYERLIPLLIYLRSAFGKACWHGLDRTARVIIDDPLLKRRYGCLDFERLASTLRRTGSGVTVAFIPWNYRRTRAQMTSTFGATSHLSVCIHGCDHIDNEFGRRGAETLAQKAKLAMQRMEMHQARTRIPFEKIMVFPQGRFATAAAEALRANSYLAAVDSACLAADGPTSRTVADLLRPAVMFHGFPIFKRHYPRHLIDFALDLFLGKPALAVEHHAYFSDGGASFEGLVRDLHRLEPNLRWPSLTSQLTRSCFVRFPSHHEVDVIFCTREFYLRNDHDYPVRYRLSKQEADPRLIHRVLVDGVAIPFGIDHGDLRFELEAAPGGTIKIEVEDRQGLHPPSFRGSKTYDARVRLRRMLSEFRDDRLARHPAVAGVAAKLARRLGLRVAV